MDKLNEILDMLINGDIDKEDVLKFIAEIIDSATVKDEPKNEEQQIEEEDNEEEEKVETKQYSKLYKAQLLPANADPEDIEAVKNAIKTNMKIPINLEHTNEILGEVVNLIEDKDGYYAEFKLNKSDFESYPYLSAEITLFKEDDNVIPILTGVALTSNPALPVKKIERIPEKVYSSIPKSIRLLAYIHPRKSDFFKLLNTFSNPKVEAQQDVYEVVRKKIYNYLEMRDKEV